VHGPLPSRGETRHNGRVTSWKGKWRKDPKRAIEQAKRWQRTEPFALIEVCLHEWRESDARTDGSSDHQSGQAVRGWVRTKRGPASRTPPPGVFLGFPGPPTETHATGNTCAGPRVSVALANGTHPPAAPHTRMRLKADATATPGERPRITEGVHGAEDDVLRDSSPALDMAVCGAESAGQLALIGPEIPPPSTPSFELAGSGARWPGDPEASSPRNRLTSPGPRWRGGRVSAPGRAAP